MNDLFFTRFTAWQSGTGQDANSLVAALGEVDLDGEERLTGATVEIGADEVGSGVLFADGFEAGDTSAWSITVP